MVFQNVLKTFSNKLAIPSPDLILLDTGITYITNTTIYLCNKLSIPNKFYVSLLKHEFIHYCQYIKNPKIFGDISYERRQFLENEAIAGEHYNLTDFIIYCKQVMNIN